MEYFKIFAFLHISLGSCIKIYSIKLHCCTHYLNILLTFSPVIDIDFLFAAAFLFSDELFVLYFVCAYLCIINYSYENEANSLSDLHFHPSQAVDFRNCYFASE